MQADQQATQVLDGPISKDACTLQDVILSGEKVDDKTGLRVANALLTLLAHRHSSSYAPPHFSPHAFELHCNLPFAGTSVTLPPVPRMCEHCLGQ